MDDIKKQVKQHLSTDKSSTSFDLSVVIPTFNRQNDLKVTLDYLKAQSEQNFEVIVIDNSSVDDTSKMITLEKAHWGNRLRYYVKEPNGPASARNLGVIKSLSKYVLFLDSDVGLHSEWIKYGLDFMQETPSAGAVGGVVVYDFDHQRVNAFGGDIGIFGLAWDIAEDTLLKDLGSPERRIWANCSAMIARRSTLLSIGGFDERFFYGYEDSDLGWRINMLAKDVWVLPNLIAYHRVLPEPGAGNAIIVRHYCKNRLSSLLQNASTISLCIKLPLYLVYSFVDVIIRKPRNAKLAGLVWNITNLKKTLFRRKLVQSQRQQSDSAIFALGQKRFFPPVPLDGQRRRTVVHKGVVKSETNSKVDDRV